MRDEHLRGIERDSQNDPARIFELARWNKRRGNHLLAAQQFGQAAQLGRGDANIELNALCHEHIDNPAYREMAENYAPLAWTGIITLTKNEETDLSELHVREPGREYAVTAPMLGEHFQNRALINTMGIQNIAYAGNTLCLATDESRTASQLASITRNAANTTRFSRHHLSKLIGIMGEGQIGVVSRNELFDVHGRPLRRFTREPLFDLEDRVVLVPEVINIVHYWKKTNTYTTEATPHLDPCTDAHTEDNRIYLAFNTGVTHLFADSDAVQRDGVIDPRDRQPFLFIDDTPFPANSRYLRTPILNTVTTPYELIRNVSLSGSGQTIEVGADILALLRAVHEESGR